MSISIVRKSLIILVTVGLSIIPFSVQAIQSYNCQSAYNYAYKYYNKVCSDGYFWKGENNLVHLGSGNSVPNDGVDCAHFVSCCIGNESNEQGGGLDVPSRTAAYGEPGAGNLGEWLLGLGDSAAREVSSINDLQKGDVILYDWDGGSWDHAAFYLGDQKVSAHSSSHWNANWDLGGARKYLFIQIISSNLEWDFNQKDVSFETKFEGWQIWNNGRYATQNSSDAADIAIIPDGDRICLVINPGLDPQLISPTLSLDSSQYNAVEFEMKNECLADTPDNRLGNVFYRNKSMSNFEPDRKVDFTVLNDGKFNHYLVFLGNSPGWEGTITNIRIDPVSNGAGTTDDDIRQQGSDNIVIDYIRLINYHLPVYSSLQNGNFEEVGAGSCPKSWFSQIVKKDSTIINSTYDETLGEIKCILGPPYPTPNNTQYLNIFSKENTDLDYIQVIQTVKIEEGKTYGLAGKYITDAAEGKVKVFIQYLYDSAYPLLDFSAELHNSPLETKDFSLRGTAPKGSRAAKIYLRLCETGCTVKFDNIQFGTEVGIEQPPTVQQGTITVTTNRSEATFTISGPATYDGTGTSWIKPDASIGTYSITFHPITGYNTPADSSKTLATGGTISFNGNYQLAPENPPSTNNPPVANAGLSQTVNEGSIVTLNGSSSSDPDNDNISYLWNQTAGTLVSLSNISSVQPTFIAPEVDSSGEVLSFKLTVTDPDGLFSYDNITVNIRNIPKSPIADAGPDQTIIEGKTVVLDGSKSSDPDKDHISYLWEQIGGPTVTLSDNTAIKPTFVPSPVDPAGTMITFQLTVKNSADIQARDEISIAIDDNDITDLPSDAIPLRSFEGKHIGIKVNSSGDIVKLDAINPNTVPEAANKPKNLIYGLIDTQIKVNSLGDTATVTIYLPEPVPSGYKWYKYSPNRGWYDYSEHAVFNANRDQVTLTLIDGGIGDDDGVQNGIIIDPSGLGSAPDSKGKPDGCFITAIGF